MKTVLFVLGNYYPKPSANGICCEKCIRQLQTQGYRVLTLSCEQVPFEESEYIDSNGHFHFTAPLNYKAKWLAEQKQKPLTKKIFKAVTFLTDRMSLFVSARHYPLMNGSLWKEIYRKIREVHSRYPIDAIVGVSYPVDAVYAVSRYKADHPDIRSIGYYLDPFVDGRTHKFLSPKKAFEKACAVERQVIRQLDLTIAQVEHRPHYESMYGEDLEKKIRFLGVPLLEEKKCTQGTCRNAVFAGSLYEKIRNPKWIIEVFKKLPEVRFDIYTPADKKWIEGLIDGAENIVYHGKVSHDEIEKIMSQASLLINIGNDLKNSSPSKLLEYFGYCKRIVSTYSVDGDPAIAMMERYPLGLALDARSTDVEGAAFAIRQLLERDARVDFAELKQALWENTPEAFAELLNACTFDPKV